VIESLLAVENGVLRFNVEHLLKWKRRVKFLNK